jgi:hypothetical protein
MVGHASAMRRRNAAPLRANRAVVLTLWAAIAAECLDHPEETALTPGRLTPPEPRRADTLLQHRRHLLGAIRSGVTRKSSGWAAIEEGRSDGGISPGTKLFEIRQKTFDAHGKIGFGRFRIGRRQDQIYRQTRLL